MRNLGQCLSFALDGKLEKLRLAGSPNLLHEWEPEVNLGGKKFRPAGWDECFPTIDWYQTSPVMGELVGLSPETHWQTDCVEQTWRSPRFLARRRFCLATSTRLGLAFQFTSCQNVPFEFYGPAMRCSVSNISCWSACRIRLS